MTTSPLRLVVFDVDGTLVDSQHVISDAMTTAFTAVGRPPPPPGAVRRVIGLSLPAAMDALVPDLDPAARDMLVEQYKAGFVAQRTGPDPQPEPLFPGVREVLRALDEDGVLLGLATGKSRRGVDVFLERHGLEGRFVTIQTADDGPGKPDPSMLLRAMGDCGCDPEWTAMIGDTTYDMEMSRRARVTGLGVAWGYHTPEELARTGAMAVVEAFPEALERLRDHWAAGMALS